ncbi:hypothetical protein KNP414_00431 [Paenibacillus mucilaginosus KNP414]|uniref:Uncharacterized protein n=1 Tax=Paenibacillus mucilaginosus (strain KNP414) TaxID=1036673 RepID=F8FPA6_PAEMK|nr:hypothetical protein KNP414_00431 [Paenibacillus mucilaginosus KNP414]
MKATFMRSITERKKICPSAEYAEIKMRDWCRFYSYSWGDRGLM